MKKKCFIGCFSSYGSNRGGCGTVNNKVVSQKNDKTNVCIMKKNIYLTNQSIKVYTSRVKPINQALK